MALVRNNHSGENRPGTVSEYLSALKNSPRFGRLVVFHQETTAQDGKYAKPARPWPEEIEKVLRQNGISALYTHQVKATDLVREGKGVIVATPTASGKTLIYNLPVFERILSRSFGRALYLFPLKALAQDQLKAIQELVSGLTGGPHIRAMIYDGDTSAYQRRKIRENPPDILITNPEMLHLSFLPYHRNWQAFFRELTFVVIDEVHTYRGVFGSHMSWVIRRLKRICRVYGSDPVFLLSSATIANPEELARNLVGTDLSVITETGAPRGKRHVLLLNPEESAAGTACQLLEAALKRDLRTIVYTQSRKVTELISVWTGRRMGQMSHKLSSYRAGYLPDERRDIEARLANGDLLGVVSTSALELGIDIGGLEICILVGYPGSMMATWQRGGRVGRGFEESLVILVAQEDALDQYFMRHPHDFFQRQVEAAMLNPENRVIAKKHLICAVAEEPLAADDLMLFDKAAQKAVEELAVAGSLLLGADGEKWFGVRKYPHREIDLRGAGSSFTICLDNEEEQLLGSIDGVRCFTESHPGAVYLHRGQTYLVTALDIEARKILVKAGKMNYFTRSLGHKNTEILETLKSKTLYNFRVSLGNLRVTETVTGFQKRVVGSRKLIATEPLDLPPQVFETEGLWIEIPRGVQEAVEKEKFHFMGGIHALEHAAIGIMPLIVLCDRSDVGGISQPVHPQLAGAAIFIYDGYAGGVGLSRKAFERIEELVRLTREVVNSCPCELGCPSCVHSPRCGSGNRPIDKEAAMRLLDGILQKEDQAAFWKPVPHPCIVRPHTPAMTPKRFGVMDLETKRSAAEVGGWHRAERMGISVAVLYDSKDEDYLVFREHEIPALIERVRRLDLLVGFNIKRFDSRVLSAYTSFDLTKIPCLDILEKVEKQLGYRLSLDHLATHTLNLCKSGNGLQALAWFKEGNFDKIIEYCKKDVEITRDLFLYGLKNHYFLFKNKAGFLVRLPARW